MARCSVLGARCRSGCVGASSTHVHAVADCVAALQVRCRGPKYAVYCSVEQLPRTIRPTSIAVRPAVNSAFRERVAALAQEPRDTSTVSGAVAAVTRMRAALQEAEASRAHGATPNLSPSAFPSPDVGTVTVINHKGDATALPFRGALFGGGFKCGLFRLVAADPPSACQELYNAEDLRGAVVLVRRGDCFFESKARQVQQAGGSAVIVCVSPLAPLRGAIPWLTSLLRAAGTTSTSETLPCACRLVMAPPLTWSSPRAWSMPLAAHASRTC